MSSYFVYFLLSFVLLAEVKTVHPHPAPESVPKENKTSSVPLKPIPSLIKSETPKVKVDAFDAKKPESHNIEETPIQPPRLRRSIHLPYGKGMSDQPIRDLEAILSGDYKGKDLLRLLANFVPNDQVFDPYYNYDEDVIDLVSSKKKPGSVVSGVSKQIVATPLSDTISLMKSGIGSPLAMSSDDGENEGVLPLLSNKVMKHTNSFATRSTNSAFSKRSMPNDHSQERIQFTILPDGKLALVLRGPGESNRYILLSFPQHLFADGIPIIQRAIL